MLSQADLVVAVSSGLVETFNRCGVRSPVVLLTNSVDVNTYTPGAQRAEREAPQILFVGNLTERKGLLDLFAASRILDERGVNHEVVVVGGRPDEGSDAEDKVRESIPPHVSLTGARRPDQMPALYQDADIFCLPSWWEAAPLSVLEAMASQLPIVATNVGDVPIVVRDGIDGLLVGIRQPSALADALHELLKDAERRRSIGQSARDRVVDEYSGEQAARTLADLYRGLDGAAP
jgi:glycosyltransferase involved in cell wall biosynthesis